MRANILAALLLLAVLIIGCGPAGSGTRGTNDGEDAQGDDLENLPKQCTEAIDYNILIAALPGDVSGFSPSAEADGTTMTFNDPSSGNELKYSAASVNLAKDDQYIDISVMDTCYVQYLSGSWFGYAQYEGTQGYLKKTTVDGQQAWKQFDKESGTYAYFVLVEDRVFVSVTGSDGVSESDVDAAANAVDYGKIADAAE